GAIAFAFGFHAFIGGAHGQSLGCEIPVAAQGTLIARCHKGYVTIFDAAAKVPYLVAYRLTGPHTLGCSSRKGLSFKVDALAPAADQGRPNDYHGSGYDLGHMAPNQDFAWDAAEQRDTFSMLNVAPQVPGLNRQGWEALEEDVRAWALERGTVDVYVGAVITAGDATIGAHHVDVPAAFWKVIADPSRHEAIAFEMPNEPVAKGDLAPYLVSIPTVDKILGTVLPIAAGADEGAALTVWPADLKAWRKAHSDACTKTGS